MSNDVVIFVILSAVLAFVWALADGTCTGASFCSPHSLAQSLRW